MSSSPPSDHVKVVLLGHQNVGKTSLTVRILHNRFDDAPHQETLGGAFGKKRFFFENDHSVVLGIWDTAGSERFRSMTRQFYRNASAAVLCFDSTQKSSWEIMKSWYNELRYHEPDCRIYFCGTKSDLVRQVDQNAVNDFMSSLGQDFSKCHSTIFETSSKNGEGVSELFNQIAEDFLHRNSNDVVKPIDRHGVKKLHQKSSNFKKCSC